MLYASLDKINTAEKNIITIEDPVEYKLKGIRQIQVNNKVDLTFASGLRSILRQDPDVMMVGEIRDHETAEIAIHSALTGHLVFTTLHTNDAPGATTRLIDMGVEPFLISSSLLGVLAQRLVRVICKDCKEEYTPTENALKDLGLEIKEIGSQKFYRGKGCPKCLQTGYKGRIGIFELLVLSGNDKLRDLILSKAPTHELRKEACVKGMITLREDGIRRVKEGLTTIEEVMRVTQEE
jgi:type II secretory ATPase GspE/PulE/Tfp pilus assembly ATPase PilB-like protein